MTEERLCHYRSLKAEAEDQEKRLDKLYGREVTVVAGKVKASMSTFPYTEYRVGVQMDDPKEADELRRLIKKKENRIKEITEWLNEVEEFLSEINDSELRRIFELRYVDGMKQREVGKILNLDRSVISRKISNYLNLHTKHTNDML